MSLSITMMSDSLTDTLCTFEQPVKATPAVLRTLSELYAEAIPDSWQRYGFHDIRPEESSTPCRLYTACLKGDSGRCVLALGEPAAGFLRLNALSDALYERIEQEFTDAPVLYACLVLTEQELLLFGPTPLRVEGKWLNDKADFDQFLPRSRRAFKGGLYGALLGDVFNRKRQQQLFPYLIEAGTPMLPSVAGIDPEQRRDKTRFFLRASESTPCWQGLVQIEEEEKRLSFLHALFCHESEPYTELELVSRSEEYAVFGLIELLTRSGARLWAESPEAVVYGAELAAGRRYQWALSMVAEDCRYNTQEFRITSGAAFEFMKEEYRRENGEEPPEDFALTMSTAAMRALNQDEEGEFAATAFLTGVVEELREVPLPAAEFAFDSCLLATVRCIPEDEETLVSVYLTPAVLGDYVPKVGDNIACSGTLQASARELCAGTDSWQDSAALAEQMEERAYQAEAHGLFDACKESSLALGAVAAAFAKAGWEVESVDPEHFSRAYVPLAVRHQDGTLYDVFVDTIIDGHEPQYSYASQREVIEKVYREDGDRCIFAAVELSYKPAADRYAVRMTLSPEQEGVENALTWTAEGFRGTLSKLTDKGVIEEATRPEQLDEAMAARTLCRAFSEAEWAEAAKWMREEMRYSNPHNGTELYGKIDVLRYFTERIEKSKADGTWQQMSMATGTLVYEGKRRPALMLALRGIPVGMLMFNDCRGCIGSVEMAPYDCVASFMAEMPLSNADLPEGVMPVTQSRELFRPEHGLAALPDMPEGGDFAQAVGAVVRFLQQRGTPCVAGHAEQELLPHLWFREADGRLAYICVTPQGKRISREIIPHVYKGYCASLSADGEVQLFPIKP